jgi:hypothetical protein
MKVLKQCFKPTREVGLHGQILEIPWWVKWLAIDRENGLIYGGEYEPHINDKKEIEWRLGGNVQLLYEVELKPSEFRLTVDVSSFIHHKKKKRRPNKKPLT